MKDINLEGIVDDDFLHPSGVIGRNAALRFAGEVFTPRLISFPRRYIKRVFDVTVSVLMLVLFLPLFALIAAAIVLTDGRPVFFGHARVGRHGRSFKCLKFRTMVRDGDNALEKALRKDPALRREWNEYQKLTDDPRVIPGIGALLRKSSLDELPQLLNVVAGHMSMVGPRPVTEQELERYGHYKRHYLALRPGLTGAWQIGGRSEKTYDERVAMDVNYVETATLRTDLRIFFATAFSFLTGGLKGSA